MAKKTDKLPTLYSQNADGSINEWTIYVEKCERPIGIEVPVIVTDHGRVGGAIQQTRDVVTAGKNEGKQNATTPWEQAVKEAKSKWTKKKKSGYVEKQSDAKAGKVDAIIEGGVLPMLAQKWRDHAKKMPFPAKGQPKLDGIRCEAIVKNGKCTLWTRTRKPINSVPHVIKAIEACCAELDIKNFSFDGELYNHDLKADFEKIVSLIRNDKPCEDSELAQYHIYDCISNEHFEARSKKLESIVINGPALRFVETVDLNSAEEVEEYQGKCLEDGYEGCMVRASGATKENPTGGYEVDRRSYGLLKVKQFEDNEFEIVGAEEGRGSMAGKAVFVCKVNPKLPASDDNTFRAKMRGKLESLRQYLNNPKIVGLKLTVRHQAYTKYGKPRIPVGIAVRDYE
jgi:DNA ligase-1